MAILRFKLVDEAPSDGQAIQLVHIDGLSGDAGLSGGSAAITGAEVQMLDSTATATAKIEDGILKLGIPKGDKGDPGAEGTAATIQVGTVSSLEAGATPTVTNSGTSSAAVLDFGIPQGSQGEKGNDGSAATIQIGSVSSLAAGATPTVTNSGTSSAAVLDFGIPQGTAGVTGATGVGVASISLTVVDGAVTAGTWTDTNSESHSIEINSSSGGNDE